MPPDDYEAIKPHIKGLEIWLSDKFSEVNRRQDTTLNEVSGLKRELSRQSGRLHEIEVWQKGVETWRVQQQERLRMERESNNKGMAYAGWIVAVLIGGLNVLASILGSVSW